MQEERFQKEISLLWITDTQGRWSKIKYSSVFSISTIYNFGVWERVCLFTGLEKQPTRSPEANNVGPQANIV